MKNLLLVVMFALAFVACSDDDDDWSAKDIVGKWSIYEIADNGSTEEADLDTQLSYLEFKGDNSYETYDYYTNSTIKGTYSLEGSVLTVVLGKEKILATIFRVG